MSTAQGGPVPPAEPVAGRFRLLEPIGHGGMGTVWRAWDLKHGRLVAAKVLAPTDAGMLLRFVREQSLRIQHPHVVAPTGWAADDERVVLAMDLVRGGSLETLMGDHGALPEDYVAVVLAQVLSALVAIHAAGVVHRDVKPANVLLEPTGTGRPHVRVSDFGIASVLDEPRLTQRAGSLGTVGYMAPEQATGAEADPRADLYSVGVLGQQLLTGLPTRLLPERHPSRYWLYLGWLASPDRRRRPASAEQALAELRRIGVPDGAPWRHRPDAPEVFDQIDEPDAPRTDVSQPAPKSRAVEARRVPRAVLRRLAVLSFALAALALLGAGLLAVWG